VRVTSTASEPLAPEPVVALSMPVILAPADYDLWLDTEEQDRDRLRALLRPCPDEWLEYYPVGRRVNDPRGDDPR